ncbi:hypothetical protein Leryth_016848 [Lithospermum erythrorhizon]|nr:hypothetical protein Leryth_016848 [Lithospermum erythrorhizon]
MGLSTHTTELEKNIFTISGFLLLLGLPFYLPGIEGAVGVNYGAVANNLPPPEKVAHYLLHSTIINRVRLFDANSGMIQAFASTGIAITVTIPNDQIPHLTTLSYAHQWVKINIVPHIPATNVVRILVGNEVLSTGNALLVSTLVPAMQTLHTALVGESLDRRIQVSTPHSLGILANSTPPSTGKFHQGYDIHVLKPLLNFLRVTNSPFLVNAYPFFGCTEETLDYAIFRPNPGVADENTKLTYTNMLDAQLDAIYSAMKLLGFHDDIEIVIAETGWPSRGDPGQFGIDQETAAAYNRNLIQHVSSGVGTPLMPHRTFETYIFALFNENLKPGPTCERNFGIFQPDMTPVYDIGILRPTARSPTIPPKFEQENPGPGESRTVKSWCVRKPLANDGALQRNIDYACGFGGIDCGPIQEGGQCFHPNTVRAHATYAMNAYYQSTQRNDFDCDFKQTGEITTIDPSYGTCKYN